MDYVPPIATRWMGQYFAYGESKSKAGFGVSDGGVSV
jgi:hypothetical protein